MRARVATSRRLGSGRLWVTAGIVLLMALSGCSSNADSARTTGPSTKADAASGSADAEPAVTVGTVDVCAWADQALANAERLPILYIPDSNFVATGNVEQHYVTPSNGRNEIIETGEEVTVSCNLLYGDKQAVSLRISLNYDSGRNFEEPDSSEIPDVLTETGPIQLSGYRGYAEPSAPLILKLEDATYLEVEVANADARHYDSGEANLWGAIIPVAFELAELWAAGSIPVLGEAPDGPASAALDWAVPSTICSALDQDLLGSMLGVDASQTLSIESNADSGVAPNGLTTSTIHCTYEAVPYRNDPLYPHRVEIQLFRYETPEDGAQAFAVFDGYGADCPTDGTAVMQKCEGGNTTTATHAGRLMPYIQTFDGRPSSLDAATLHAQVLALGASALIALTEFS